MSSQTNRRGIPHQSIRRHHTELQHLASLPTDESTTSCAALNNPKLSLHSTTFFHWFLYHPLQSTYVLLAIDTMSHVRMCLSECKYECFGKTVFDLYTGRVATILNFGMR